MDGWVGGWLHDEYMDGWTRIAASERLWNTSLSLKVYGSFRKLELARDIWKQSNL